MKTNFLIETKQRNIILKKTTTKNASIKKKYEISRRKNEKNEKKNHNNFSQKSIERFCKFNK